MSTALTSSWMTRKRLPAFSSSCATLHYQVRTIPVHQDCCRNTVLWSLHLNSTAPEAPSPGKLFMPAIPIVSVTQCPQWCWPLNIVDVFILHFPLENLAVHLLSALQLKTRAQGQSQTHSLLHNLTHNISHQPAEAVGDTEEAEMGGPATGPAVEGLTSSAWKEIAEITGRTADELYSPLCFIENNVTDTQV